MQSDTESSKDFSHAPLWSALNDANKSRALVYVEFFRAIEARYGRAIAIDICKEAIRCWGGGLAEGLKAHLPADFRGSRRRSHLHRMAAQCSVHMLIAAMRAALTSNSSHVRSNQLGLRRACRGRTSRSFAKWLQRPITEPWKLQDSPWISKRGNRAATAAVALRFVQGDQRSHRDLDGLVTRTSLGERTSPHRRCEFLEIIVSPIDRPSRMTTRSLRP